MVLVGLLIHSVAHRLSKINMNVSASVGLKIYPFLFLHPTNSLIHPTETGRNSRTRKDHLVGTSAF